MTVPKLRHSATLYNTFVNCERKAFLNVRHKDEEVESAAMRKGRRVHAMLEEMALERVKTGRWPDPEDPYAHRLQEVGFFDDVDPVQAEGWIRGLYWKGEELPWIGKVDLLSRDTVYDYKVTGNPNRVFSLREARRSIQLLSYCLATGRRQGEFVYLLPTKVVRVHAAFSEEELTRAFQWFRMEGDVIRARWEALNPECENWERVFALAPPDYFLCSEKWCSHWHRCLGREE